jgi:hypothetical protein
MHEQKTTTARKRWNLELSFWIALGQTDVYYRHRGNENRGKAVNYLALALVEGLN